MILTFTEKDHQIKRAMTSTKKRSKFTRCSAVQERPFDGLFSVITQEMLLYSFLWNKALQKLRYNAVASYSSQIYAL